MVSTLQHLLIETVWRWTFNYDLCAQNISPDLSGLIHFGPFQHLCCAHELIASCNIRRKPHHHQRSSSAIGMTTGTNTALTRSTKRWIGALADWSTLDQPDDPGKSGFRSDGCCLLLSNNPSTWVNRCWEALRNLCLS